MSWRGVIFDLDGTLLDTLADIANSANQALERLGYPVHPIDGYRSYIGEGVHTLFARALPCDGQNTPELVVRCVAEFREHYSRNWDVHTRPYEGIPELLDALAALPMRLAVLSNKPDEFARRCVARYLPRARFEIILGMRDDIPRKPDPAGAIHIAQQLAIAPEQFLYVGDSAIDMMTARSAGMCPIGVRWGFRSGDELKASGAARIIDYPLELLELLSSSCGASATN